MKTIQVRWPAYYMYKSIYIVALLFYLFIYLFILHVQPLDLGNVVKRSSFRVDTGWA